MYLIIDNYDSFTWNLYQYLTQICDGEVSVVRNDRITIEEIEKLRPQGIIISPGPGRPEEAGISVETVKAFAGRIPILGVCLGHQAIGAAFGVAVTGAQRVVHGKTDAISHDGRGLFRNLPSPVRLTRYHSLALWARTMPAELEVTATSGDGEIMGVRHREHTIEGIQFHPESIASEFGMKILRNFLNYRREFYRFPEVLGDILGGREMDDSLATAIMEDLTEGELADSQAAAFLTAMNAKGVTARELASLASVLQRKMTAFPASAGKSPAGDRSPLVDTCGTGGDGAGTFNISSAAAMVAASCGAAVAKHGNRSVSSSTGSADFYEALGIPIDLSPEASFALLAETGFAFLFAPLYHRSMKHLAGVRRELGIRTVMNLLGPLVNPAGADCQLIGVHREELCLPVAEAAALLGRKAVMVVHSTDGLDEISPCAPTRVVHYDGKGMHSFLLKPDELGFAAENSSDLLCASPEEGVLMARALFSGRLGTGQLTAGPLADTDPVNGLLAAVSLNAGAALAVCGVAESIGEGARAAAQAIGSGRTERALQHILETAASLKKRFPEPEGASRVKTPAAAAAAPREAQL
jgi:anthranilate synthase/phosphoribosyltransferase